MPRATRGQIDRRLLYLRSKGLDLQLNTNATGYRIETGDGRRDLSPRLNMREMVDWLEAFETGWEMGRADGHNSYVREGSGSARDNQAT